MSYNLLCMIYSCIAWKSCFWNFSRSRLAGDEFSSRDSYHLNCIFGLWSETAWRHERDRQATLVAQPNFGSSDERPDGSKGPARRREPFGLDFHVFWVLGRI